MKKLLTTACLFVVTAVAYKTNRDGGAIFKMSSSRSDVMNVAVGLNPRKSEQHDPRRVSDG